MLARVHPDSTELMGLGEKNKQNSQVSQTPSNDLESKADLFKSSPPENREEYIMHAIYY